MRGRNRKGPNPLMRSFESNGGDVKIRGTALHVAEKYVQLARDAQASSDRVAAENYFQHAEHYYRIVAAAQAQMPQPQPIVRSDGDDEDERESRDNGAGGERQPTTQGGQAAFGVNDPQPYFNGGEQPSSGDGGDMPAEAGGHDRGDRGDRGGHGGFRRRRFRERYQERGGERPEQGPPREDDSGPPLADD
ncbi:MAG: DUF4167 domain-containing protein [Bauldia sp.]